MFKYTYLLLIALGLSSCQDYKLLSQHEGFNIGVEEKTHHAETGQEVDQLFTQLKVANQTQTIHRTQRRIRELWADHADPRIDTLMEQGVQAMYGEDYDKAIALFTEIIQQKPLFAEGWNKRATVYFVQGDLRASMQDIRETLKLEDRHFGALSGLASIHVIRGENEEALKTYQRIQRLIPQLTEVNQSIKDLKKRLGYRSI
jgi:tetratricopeptide (TPR) repeat protein